MRYCVRVIDELGELRLCGHGEDAHVHYRAGADCGRCPCRSFIPLRRWLPW